MQYRTVIIEDEDAIRELLEISARLCGHEVLSFASAAFCPLARGLACRSDGRSRCADVIITDHMLPDLEGLAFLELLDAGGCKVPRRAMVTGVGSEAVFRRARALGCTVIRKPFRVRELCDWLQACEDEIPADRDLVPVDSLFPANVPRGGPPAALPGTAFG